VFSLIKLFIGRFEELDVELVLLALTSCGSNLRKDDPMRLKEVIKLVFEKANSYGANLDIVEGNARSKKKEENVWKTGGPKKDDSSRAFSRRVQFMLEMIISLKNNKLRDNLTEEAEHLSRLRSNLNQHLKKNRQVIEVLPDISWSDLLSPERKGRKWMIGSALAAPTTQEQEEKREKLKSLANVDLSDDLRILAQQHRMNTPARKAIFCILLSSQDYLEAFERLQRLQLKSKEDRDVVNVLIYCCEQEDAFNPFYGHLAHKFCSFDANFKFSFKIAFWDKAKELEETKSQSVKSREHKNVAHLLAHLLIENALTLTVLKPLDLMLSGASTKFFTQVFTSLFVSAEPSQILTTFGGIEDCNQRNNVKKLEKRYKASCFSTKN